MALINKTVLVSDADYFTDKDAINALMDSSIQVDLVEAKHEHQMIIKAFKAAGIKVIKVESPKDCQDGIYTANWAVIRNNKALLSRLPNKRQKEEDYAKEVLREQGLRIIELPKNIQAFSGQGDCLIVDNCAFIQSPYRTSLEAHQLVKDYLDLKHVYSLQTKPSRWLKIGLPKRNRLTGWVDSPTYDIDLALAIIKPATESSPPLIAYSPKLFKIASRRLIKKLNNFDKIIVSKKEARDAFATNLVSTGETVIMPSHAPEFKRQLIRRGLKVIELDLPELKKGGGSIRCCSLTLS